MSQRYKIILVFIVTAVTAEIAAADIIFHWTLDGPLGADIVCDTDLASAVAVWAFEDSHLSPADECSLTYGEPAFSLAPGTSADFNNLTADNDPGIGLLALDEGAGTLMDLTGLGEFTIECFIYPRSIRQSVIIRKCCFSGCYYVDLRPNGALSFAINSNFNVVMTPEATITPDQWYHVAATFDQNDTAAPMKLYVDGELSAGGGLTDQVLDSTWALGIGCIVRDNNIPPSGSGQFFDGNIDEVRILSEDLLSGWGPWDPWGPTIKFAASESGGLEGVSPARLEVALRRRYVNHTYLVDYAVSGGGARGNGVDYSLRGYCACDYDESGSVGYEDLRVIAQNWLSTSSNNPAEVAGDYTVNLNDFSRLASQWRSPCDARTLRFPPGTNRRTIDIDIVNDGLQEGDETIVLTLSNPRGLRAAIAWHGREHTYTIIDPAGP